MFNELLSRVDLPPKVWLTPEEAAKHLRISIARIYQYVSANTIPFHRLPNSSLIRLNRTEIDEWLLSGSRRVEQVSDAAIRRLMQ